MMDYRENAGYIITDSCHVGDSEFVLGVHLTAPQQFVTWKCSNRTDYDWGHYFSDLFSAQKDLVARAQEEVQCLEEQRQNTIAPEAPPYSPWGKVQECETLCPGVYSVSTPGHGGIMVRREYRRATRQLKLCMGGFGASPHSRGSACYCVDLYTGKESRYERMDVLGTIQPEDLPDWAKHGLTAIQQEQAKKKTTKERER